MKNRYRENLGGLRKSMLLAVLLGFSINLLANPDWFKISDFSGALVLQYQTTLETEFLDKILKSEADRSYLEGGLQMNFDGSIYHPNLITFHVDFNLIASRAKILYFSDESLNNSLNNTYNVNLTFLKRKKTNLQLYARRGFGASDRRFSERFYLSSNSFGLKFNTSNKLLPVRLDIFRNSFYSESFTYRERDEVIDNAELRIDLSRVLGSRSSLRFRLRDYTEKVRDSRYQTYRILHNFLHFYGKKKRNSVTELFSFRKMTGDFEQEIYKFNIIHRHFIEDYLYLLNSYHFLRDNTPLREGDLHALSMGVDHRLFDSLNTRIEIKGRMDDQVTRKLTAFSYGPELNYIKKLPKGSVNIRYFNNLENGKYLSMSEVANTSETESFNLSDTIVLATPGINPETITITDSDLTQLYQEGLDYHVDVFNSIVTVLRIPGGSIPPGGQVRISYDFLAFPDFNYTLQKEQFFFNLNVFRYFHFYFRTDKRDQETSSDFLVAPFQNYVKKHYGIRWNSKWVDAEYFIENYESDLTSYESNNLRVSLGVNVSNTLKLSANVNLHRLEYNNSTYFVNFDTYYAGISFRPGPNLLVNLLFRDLNYETENYIRDRVSIISKLKWNFRKISIELFYEYILNKYVGTEKERDYFVLRIGRMF